VENEEKKKRMEIVLFEIASFRIRTSARIVVRSPNAVHSVLYRVVVFVNASRRRFLLQVEFRARILRVVYVGAIAVLFRFVVMMLNLSETTSTRSSGQYGVKTASGEVLGGRSRRLGRIRVSLYTMSENASQLRIPQTQGGSHNTGSRRYVEWVKVRDPMWGMTAFGQILYTDGMVYVVGAGMVLLVAMIGSIVLTLKVRRFARAKRQEVNQQRSRDADVAVMRVKNR